MARKETGIRRRRGGWSVFVRVRGHLYKKQFPIDKPIAELRQWRKDQTDLHGGRTHSGAGFAADVETFLEKPEIAAQAYVGQLGAMLALWVNELGADRPRSSISRDEIEAVIQRWLKRYAEPTVYHRRSALSSLYATLDGVGAANPVKETTCPKSWIPKDHSVAYEKLAAIVAAMPDWRYVKKGIRQPSAAKIVATVIVDVGIRGADLLRVRKRDINWDTAAFRWPASSKGRGVSARTVPLTANGLKAFRAFDAANLYGAFNVEAVSHAFKRTARRIDGKDTPIHLYSLRHSVGADLYRTTRDLQTVGRMLNHAPGSRATAQYAQGANADVDRAAVVSLSAARAAALVHDAPKQLPAKLPACKKRRRVKQLRRHA